MNKIDFVITWVDGSDPAWLEQKNTYSGKKSEEKTDIGRYRDMELLPYWFRAVEAYAPWVNAIHFVTWGHVPAWLNIKHPKLRIVNHEDFIPKEYLPTFNCNPITLNFWRIKDLAEKFVYFNDDFFLNSPVNPEFFFKDGLPCDFIRLRYLFFIKYWDRFTHLLANNQAVVNLHFSRKDLLRNITKVLSLTYDYKHWQQNLKYILRCHKHIPHLVNPHLPLSFLKSDFQYLWEIEPEICAETSRHKFRDATDITEWLIRDWRLMKGEFHPVNRKSRGKYLSLESETAQQIVRELEKPHKMICINDGYSSFEQFEIDKKVLRDAFEKKFPHKSSFEK